MYDEEAFRALRFNVAALDDIEATRIAMENRLRTLTGDWTSEEGREDGFNLPETDPLVVNYTEMLRVLQVEEDVLTKIIEKAMKTSPLGASVLKMQGVGLKQAARLLGAIGDPYWHEVQDRPRTVSELWAYCGLDVRNGAAPRRQKGQQSNWSDDGRKRAWLIAKSVEKQTKGKYRELYDSVKEAEKEKAVHTVECARCTPQGQPPAAPGTPMKPAHIQSRALRRVAKEVLKDLWLASKEVHEAAEPKAA